MTDDRRYTEDEIRRIFEEASKAQSRATERLPAQGGMTLGELERIGDEVGIDRRWIERAARSLDARRESGTRRMLGLPLGVGRTVELDRRLTDEEWDRLVVDLRDTFDARGEIGGSGSFRQWTNGNLQALLEPAGDRHRLRLRTTRGASRALMTAGGVMTAIALVLAVVSVLTGNADVAAALQLGLIGAGIFAVGAAPLPAWAAERKRQMEAVAARALLMASEEEPEGEEG